MNAPHRGARRAPSRARCRGVAIAVKEEIAPRKRPGCEFPRGTCEGAVEVIVGVRVLSREAWTAAAQDGCNLWGGRAPQEQFFGDPFISDAPVGLGEAFQNPQSVQPTGIDLGGGNGGRSASRVVEGSRCQRPVWRLRQVPWAAQTVLGRFPQSGALGSQAGAGVQRLHPRRVTAPGASLRFLIGEAGQAAQMTPIGAAHVTAVEVGQVFADLAGNRSFDGCGTDVHPSLEIAGTGLQYDTGFMTSGPHGLDDGWVGAIEIHEDVAGIAVLREGMEVHVAALAVANTQEADGGRTGQLGSAPQPLSGESPSGLGVNETNEIEVVRHGRELAANGLRGEIESEVEHGLNFGIEGTRRTMNSQRTANSGLTDCLSLGVHRTHPEGVALMLDKPSKI